MAKLILDNITSLQSEASAMQTLNLNFARIASAFDNTLSRDGSAPNFMTAPLDINAERLMNLGAPKSGSDAARLIDITESLVPTNVLIPAFVEDRILSNSGGSLVWVDPLDLPGLGDLKSTNNLSELTNPALARTNLELGTASQANLGLSGDVVGKLNADLTFSGFLDFTGPVTHSGVVVLGGTVNHRLSTVPTTLTQDSLGYRGTPVNVRDATYTFVLADSAQLQLHTSGSGHTWTIPPESSVAYPLGTIIPMANTGSGTVTVARGSGVALRIAGTATDKNMSLAQHSLASIIKLGANSWYISGAGVA